MLTPSPLINDILEFNHSLSLSLNQSIMASRLFSSRSKTLITAGALLRHSPSSIASPQSLLRCLHSLPSIPRSQPQRQPFPSTSSPKNLVFERTLPRLFYTNAQGGPTSQLNHSTEKEICKESSKIGGEGIVKTDTHSNVKEVMCFSPLEAVATKSRARGLEAESSKIKRVELSQKITFALIPALLLISKSSLTTSLLVFSVYWQIYGYFKEIFLDYVHQDVTRTWVLVYLKVLLLILVKDTILDFGLV